MNISILKSSFSWTLNFIVINDFFFPLIKHRAFGFSDYMASVGGLLGLIAGISLFSLIEIAYHMLRAFANRCVVNDGPKMQTIFIPSILSKRKQFLKYFLSYMRNSSIHGFYYTANRELGLFEKLFWSSCVVVSSVFCVILVVDTVNHAELNPIVIGMDSNVWSSKDVSPE